jgi:hypothetical protein
MELLTPQHIQAFEERFPLGSREGQLQDAFIVLKFFYVPVRALRHLGRRTRERRLDVLRLRDQLLGARL